MRTKQIFFVAVCFMTLLSISACAQKVKRPDSYNYQRGNEAVQKQAWDEAIKYFNLDLQENPKNGYSYSGVAYVRLMKTEYGQGLTAVEQALKYLPKKDKEFMAFAYSIRGDIYSNLGDTTKAINDFSEAIRLTPEGVKLYEKRSKLYYFQDEYDLAEADYRRITAIDPGDAMGYMGLGVLANERQQWEKAIRQFDYVTKLEPDYSSAYAFRAESYLGLEKWDEATDDILKAFNRDMGDGMAYELVKDLKEPARSLFLTKLKISSAKAPNESFWYYLAALMYSRKNDYDNAISSYEKAIEIDADPEIYAALAFCYALKGNYRLAIRELDAALNIDSTMTDFRADRARFYYEVGDIETAFKELDAVIKVCPDNANNYYLRGWYKEIKGDLDGAVEDLSISLALDPNYTNALLSRADAYLKQGKEEEAKTDFRKIIDIEETSGEFECVQYAYHALGNDEKALEVMNLILEKDTTYAGNYYDAACLYGRMGDKEKSIECIKKALGKGFRRFAHMEADNDMDLIRDTEEYKELIKIYSAKDEPVADEGEKEENEAEVGKRTVFEIPFTKESGICKVKCQINDLPLHFVFDTGASDVTLSMVEATFMMKNGYLTGRDVVGSGRYMDASGNVNVGTVINLKKVTFGDSELTNVRASVVRNQKAPLLLGQSVLGRLGKIEIDNQKRVIRITPIAF